MKTMIKFLFVALCATLFVNSCNEETKVKVTNLTLNKATLSLVIGTSETLTPIITPLDATNKTITWTSDKESVATVSSKGQITAIAIGTATITAITNDENKTATCTVTVTDSKVSVTKIELDKTTLELTTASEKVTLKVIITPETATNTKVTWKSSDEAVATVNTTGEVTPKAGGTAKITVKSEDGGFEASCDVIVTVSVTEVTLNKTTLSLVIGTQETLMATVLPTTATDKTVTWLSDNAAVTVDNAGKVAAVAAGMATITVTTKDGEKKATCIVTVTAATVPVNSVALDKTTLQLMAGAQETLSATILPDNATNKDLTWSSDTEAVATVDNTGKITAIAAGTASITATSVADDTKKATCVVTVFKDNELVNGDFSDFNPATPTLLNGWHFEPALVENVAPSWGENGWSIKPATESGYYFAGTWGSGTGERKASTWTEPLLAGTYTLTISYKSSWGVWLNVEGVETDPNKRFAELPGWVVDGTSTFTTDLTVATAGTVTVKMTVEAIDPGWERYIEIYSVKLVRKL